MSSIYFTQRLESPGVNVRSPIAWVGSLSLLLPGVLFVFSAPPVRAVLVGLYFFLACNSTSRLRKPASGLAG